MSKSPTKLTDHFGEGMESPAPYRGKQDLTVIDVYAFEAGMNHKEAEILSLIKSIWNPNTIGKTKQSNSWKLGYVRAMHELKKRITQNSHASTQSHPDHSRSA